MNNLTVLAEGPISSADQLVIVLVETDEYPPSVVIHWPLAASVATPRRFGAVALAVIALMDQAMKRLEQVRPGEL